MWYFAHSYCHEHSVGAARLIDDWSAVVLSQRDVLLLMQFDNLLFQMEKHTKGLLYIYKKKVEEDNEC